MKLTIRQINDIQKRFASIQTKEDFLLLLNVAKECLYGDKAKPFFMRQLTYHINPKLQLNRYSTFDIPKKTGGVRTIHAPNRGLKQIQRCLNIIFQSLYVPNKNAYGFVPSKSIADNAKVHIGQLYVYNIDLKDFFTSIDQARVWGRLQYPPFNLNKETNRIEIANMIASLCCHSMQVERKQDSGDFVIEQRNVLPQGAPSSPFLTNIICERLDFYLSALAKRFGLRYSRYADDITFSSMHNVYQEGSEFLKELERLILGQGFLIKPSKTRLQKRGYRQEVTGIIVSDKKINVSKRYIKNLRKWLYYWETYGYEKAYSIFKSSYVGNKFVDTLETPEMELVLAGKLEYLKMIKGENDGTYLKLRERFFAVQIKKEETKFNEVLYIWETQGIDKAMAYWDKLSKMGLRKITSRIVDEAILFL